MSLLPGGSSPARIIRSSSRCTSIGSEFDCSSAMASGAPLPGRGARGGGRRRSAGRRRRPASASAVRRGHVAYWTLQGVDCQQSAAVAGRCHRAGHPWRCTPAGSRRRCRRRRRERTMARAAGRSRRPARRTYIPNTEDRAHEAQFDVTGGSPSRRPSPPHPLPRAFWPAAPPSRRRPSSSSTRRSRPTSSRPTRRAFNKANPDIDDQVGARLDRRDHRQAPRREGEPAGRRRDGRGRVEPGAARPSRACCSPTRRRASARSRAQYATRRTRRRGSGWTSGARRSASTPSRRRSRACRSPRPGRT